MNFARINSLFIANIEAAEKNKPTSLESFLEGTMSHRDYNRLTEILGMTKTRLSRLFSGTDSWQIEDFVRLYTYLSMKYHGIESPKEFIDKYSIKNEIIIKDMDELSEWNSSFNELKSIYYSVDRKDQSVEDFAASLENIENNNIAWTGFKVWMVRYLNAA